jgi:hypothetical protein
MISLSNDLLNDCACDIELRVRDTLSGFTRLAGWNADWQVQLSPLDGAGFRVTVESVGRPIVSCAFVAPDEPVEQMLQTALEE